MAMPLRFAFENHAGGVLENSPRLQRCLKRAVWCAILPFLLSRPPAAVAQTSQPNFFLPQNPVAAAYVLGRLSDQELIAAPRSEFVYVALLQRKGLDSKYRLEALSGLAAIRHTSQLTETLRA